MTDCVFTAVDRSTGEILYSGTGYDPQTLSSDKVLILEDVEYKGGYLENGAHCDLPPQPTKHHIFDYTTKQWVDPRTAETQWPVVRAQRNARLSASDWTQLPDVPLATKEAWAAYRQALRDVTLQSDPFAIDWPVAPGS